MTVSLARAWTLVLLLAAPVLGPTAGALRAQYVPEHDPRISVPPGWDEAGFHTSQYEMRTDPTGGRNGSSCVLIRGVPGNQGFLGLMQNVEAGPYAGGRVRLVAWVKVDGATRGGRLFLRLYDRNRRRLALDNMEKRPISGSRPWRRYEVTLDVPPEAAEVAFGALLTGPGSLRVDDFALEAIGPAATDPGSLPDSPDGRRGDTSPDDTSQESDPGSTSSSPELAPGSGWLLGGSSPDDYRIELEPTGGRHGTNAASIRSITAPTRGFASLMRWIDPSAYRGKRLRLSAWVKADSVAGWAGLWMRVDRPGGRRAFAFDNMQKRPIRGTSDWRRYEVVLDVAERADRIFYGALLDGTGRIEIDDFMLEPVGPEVPVTDLLTAVPAPRNLDFDHPAPDAGSTGSGDPEKPDESAGSAEPTGSMGSGS